MRKMWLMAAVLLASMGCDVMDFADSGRYRESFHYNFDAKPGVHLTVETRNGEVSVTGWDRNTVEVDGEKYASTPERLKEIRIDARADSPDSVTLRTSMPDGWFGGGGARFTVRVPRQAMLDRVATSNGAITVDTVDGDARLHTSNGAIRTMHTHGSLVAETSNSAIEIRDHTGNVDAHSSNGHIDAEAGNGSFRAETSNSSIEARLTQPDTSMPVKLDSSNGHIILRLEGAKLPSVKADTSNSSIELRLPASAQAHIEAETSNSDVTSDFGLTVPPGSTHTKHRLEGTIGSGGPDIRLHSSNGSIRILKGI